MVALRAMSCDAEVFVHAHPYTGTTEGSDAELAAILPQVRFVLVSPHDKATLGALVAKAPALQAMQTLSAGLDFLDDISPAFPPSLTVCRTSSMDRSIAEYVICALLDWSIGYRQLHTDFQSSKFFAPPFLPPVKPFHSELGGKTLGIVGYGPIAAQIAHLAAAFGMKVTALTRSQRETPPAPLIWAGDTSSHYIFAFSEYVFSAFLAPSLRPGLRCQ